VLRARGQGLADYAIALALIAIVVVLALILLSGPGMVRILSTGDSV
jgi:hypothetical protein